MTNSARTKSPAPTRPSFAEGVAQKVIDACKQEDPDARITYVGRDENQRTRVRVRSGKAASVQSLQRALTHLMPFSQVRTSEDVLDGEIVAEIVVPTKSDEYKMALAKAADHPLSRFTNMLSIALVLVGIGMWISNLSTGANEASTG